MKYCRYKEARSKGTAAFVFCGSALNNIGITPLMDFIVDCGATPDRHPFVAGKNVENEPLSAQVFKTIADPYIGRLNMFRLFTGHLKADSVVYNANKEKEEKIAQILIMTGKEQANVPELHAGDIGAVAKLSVTGTGDTLCTKANPVILDPIDFPKPTLSIAIEPKSKGDEDNSAVLSREFWRKILP